ncbi:ribonuclease P protein component [Bacillaceae bacterium]
MRRENRLKKNEDFQKIFRYGKSTANRQFVIYLLEGKEEGFRAGISVSKKIGKAVVRNRVKRLVREAIRAKEDRIRPRVDFVVIARTPVADMDYEELSKCLYHAMGKAKLFRCEACAEDWGGKV